MPSISHSPTYNLKAVLKETGLKADVLRAWERRYDLPKPQRTPGGHRLYSEYDIQTVRWLRERQAEGLSISRAVEMWKEMLESGKDPLAKYPAASVAAPRSYRPVADARIESLRRSWIEAALNFDGTQADEILTQAFAIYPVETVCNQVIQEGISEIGNSWYIDQASVQQEHFASALASRRLETLITASPEPTRAQTILVGCPPNEQHTLSVLMLSLLLRRKGFKVVYLGADTPFARLEETIAVTQANLIVLAAQQLITAATLRMVAIHFEKKGLRLAYGGLIFNRIPQLRQRIPAYFLGETLDEAMRSIDQLIKDPQSFQAHKPQTGEANLDELSQQYQAKRPAIESVLHEIAPSLNLRPEHLLDANFFFGNALAAALELGDPAYLEADLAWVRKLLTGRKILTVGLTPYLKAYYHAIDQIMGKAGTPITHWLDTYITQKDETDHQFSDIIGDAQGKKTGLP